MADGTDGSSSAGDAASGGADGNGSVATGAQGDGGTIDYKARYEESQRLLAKATGKAGSTQADLTTQLSAANAASATATARADKAMRSVLERDVLDEVLEKAPAHTRKAIRLVASSMLEKHPEIKQDTDGTFATTAKAIVDKITADAPELFAAKSNVGTAPHVATGSEPSKGVVVLDSGKVLF